MPKATRTVLGHAKRMSAGILNPITSGYRRSGIRGAIGGAKKPLMFGGGILGAGNIIGSRRQSGLDRTVGRPTGMYNY